MHGGFTRLEVKNSTLYLVGNNTGLVTHSFFEGTYR